MRRKEKKREREGQSLLLLAGILSEGMMMMAMARERQRF
jgi:hypothetical protein